MLCLGHSVYLSSVFEARTAEECDQPGANEIYVRAEALANHSQHAIRNIRDFCERIQSARDEGGPGARIIVGPAQDKDESISTARLFLGAYLILNMGWDCQTLMEAFGTKWTSVAASDTSNLKDLYVDCWRALHHAKRLGWLVDPASDLEPVMDVDEFVHYACRVNGGVSLSLPGKMLFFPTPASLPDHQLWADSVGEDGRAIRRFGAPFYADLLHDLGVSVVVCLGRSSSTDAAAMRARGMETVDLALSEDGSSLLRGLDRLLTLERCAPGLVAVHSGEGRAWPGYVGTLVSALMISRLGFEEGSAGAWLRMVSPWMFASSDSDVDQSV
jgi:hypothetical protein